MGMDYETIQDSSNAMVTSLLLALVFLGRDSFITQDRNEHFFSQETTISRSHS